MIVVGRVPPIQLHPKKLSTGQEINKQNKSKAKQHIINAFELLDNINFTYS